MTSSQAMPKSVMTLEDGPRELPGAWLERLQEARISDPLEPCLLWLNAISAGVAPPRAHAQVLSRAKPSDKQWHNPRPLFLFEIRGQEHIRSNAHMRWTAKNGPGLASMPHHEGGCRTGK